MPQTWHSWLFNLALIIIEHPLTVHILVWRVCAGFLTSAEASTDQSSHFTCGLFPVISLHTARPPRQHYSK